MAGFSDATEIDILDHVFKNGAMSQPTNLYVGLTTTTITDAHTGTTVPGEPGGGAYARKKCNTFTNAAAGSLTNSIKIEYAEATAAWGTVTDFFVADHSSTGDIIGYAKLSVAKKIGTNDTAKFATNDLKASLD